MNITLGGLLVVVLAGILIKFATKFLIKLLGWVLLLALGAYAMYHFGIGPFDKNPFTIASLEAKYCDAPEEQIKCDCIVQLVKKDLESRFSKNELTEIEADRAQLIYVVQKSFNTVKPDIVECIGADKAEKVLSDFRNDLIPIDNDILENLIELKDDISDSAKNQVDELTKKKEVLDEKYD